MMEIVSLLQTQEEQLGQMQGVLEDEFALLAQRQALALPALSERKQQLLAAIESLDNRLAQSASLAAYPEHVERISRLLATCQEQNDINGRLLERCIVANRRLASMLSKQRDRHSLTYDAKGNTRSGTRSYGIKA